MCLHDLHIFLWTSLLWQKIPQLLRTYSDGFGSLFPNLLGVLRCSFYYSLQGRQTEGFIAGTYVLDAWRGCHRVDERGICVVDNLFLTIGTVEDVYRLKWLSARQQKHAARSFAKYLVIVSCSR